MASSHRYLVTRPLYLRIKRTLVTTALMAVLITLTIFGPFTFPWWVIASLIILGTHFSLVFSRRLFGGQQMVIDTLDQKVWVSPLETSIKSSIRSSSTAYFLSDLQSCTFLKTTENTELFIEMTAVEVDQHELVKEAKKSKSKKKKKKKSLQSELIHQKNDASSVPKKRSVVLLRSTESRFIRVAYRHLEHSLTLNQQMLMLRHESNDPSLESFDKKMDQSTLLDRSKTVGLMSVKKSLTYSVLTLFLGIQMWVAGSYYLSDYPWDERFSWRMFSTVRSLSCQPRLWFVDPQKNKNGGICPDGQTPGCTPLRLSSQYHMVWVNLLKRGRLQVLDRIVEDRCQSLGEDAAVFMELTCPSPKPPHTAIVVQSPLVNLCASPQWRHP